MIQEIFVIVVGILLSNFIERKLVPMSYDFSGPSAGKAGQDSGEFVVKPSGFVFWDTVSIFMTGKTPSVTKKVSFFFTSSPKKFTIKVMHPQTVKLTLGGTTLEYVVA